MTKQGFLDGLQEELELDNTLSLDTEIKQLDEWDSMTAMMLIGYVSSEFGVTLNANDLEAMTNIESLIEKIGIEKFE